MPQLGLGTWQLNSSECIHSVKRALELGYTHIDTAEMYMNEEEIGVAIKNSAREKLFITSKVWQKDLTYERVLKACEISLTKLGTEYLDLYLIHLPYYDTFNLIDRLTLPGSSNASAIFK